ncbi:ABC transporter permease [Arthrobacter sp. FW305-BF8]|uniref:ABC transporter permease n=1 Tax=Arthrobacter sp. FW305-BF8 TaxID=2879617 RepID=UPI001F31644A|nr:ABC transporter permease [Arthrobacter sp. FW305-BF8]UKA55194.1 ABC transporter permease [Arthrobacter sp. FW305-BF8]
MHNEVLVPGGVDRAPSSQNHARSSPRRTDLKYRVPSKYLASWIALAAVLIIAIVVQPATFDRFSVLLITALAGCLLLASLGQNLVVMVGAIDLSVPALITLAAALSAHLVGEVGSLEAFLIIVVASAGISAISGALIAYLRLNALIVTFAMNAVVASGLILWLGQSYSSAGQADKWLVDIASGSWLNVSSVFWLALAVAGAVAFLLSHTRLGRRVAAIGDNRQAAHILGVRTGLGITTTFACAGICYALAGMALAGVVKIPNATIGAQYQLTTITVVAIAGTSFAGGGSSIAALSGAALLLPTLTQILALQNLSPGALYIVQSVLLVGAVSLNIWSQLGRNGWHRLRSRFSSPVTSP